MALETKPSLSARISAWLRFLGDILDSSWAFVMSLFSKSRAPFQNSHQSIQPQGDTQKKAKYAKGESPLGESPAKPEVPKTDTKKKKPCCSSACFLRWGNFVVQCLIFIAASVYGGIAWNQWRTQLHAMKIDQRAWVTVNDILLGVQQDEDWTIRIRFKNTGKTPAKNFVIWGAGESVTKGQIPTADETKLPGRGVIAPDGIFHSNLNIVGRYDWKSIDLVIHGRIQYDSVFGHGHWTKFCYYFVPDKTGKDGGFAPCDSGNDIDNGPP